MSTSHENNMGIVWQIWLLNSINNSRSIADNLEEARSLINNLKIFENIIECEQFIRSLSNNDRIIFIANDQLGQQIIPQIHELQQLFAIYVYTTEEQPNELWFKQFSKFRGIRTQMNELADLSRRRSDRRSRRRDDDDQFSFDILGGDIEQGQSTAELDGRFVHSQLLIDCLQGMKSNSEEIKEFIRFCQNHKDCKDSKKYSEHLDEFQSEYSSKKSLWWYTRDSFVYRMLNKALRVQHIDALFAFRFFIRDLAQELKANQWLYQGSVYRGQFMSKDEVKRLEESTGKLISINSFLSTSLDPTVAHIYYGDRPDFEKVLFKIDFDPMVDGIKPFANITPISDFPDEGEVLFMLGSVFQIQKVYYNEDGVWIIQLNLCSDNDQALKSIFSYLRRETNRCQFDLLAFGNVLHDMGEFEQAKNYYKRCLKILPSDDRIWKPYCYYLLGLIDTVNGQEKRALQLFENSLSIRTQTLHPSDPSLADTLIGIARVHYINYNFDQALELYKKALIIFHQAFGDDDLTSAMTYNNMGVVCTGQGKYSEALDYHQKALSIRQRHLPPDHFRFGTSNNNMGEIYQGLGQYDTAMNYHESALEIYKKSLPSGHVDIAILLINKSLIYAKTTGLQDALPFHKKAYDICRHIWSDKNPHFVQIKHIIENLESIKEMNLSESLETTWLKLFRPFKCIASLDPRALYRETHQLCAQINAQ